MKQPVGGQNQGYTIVEALIFLAVTGAMFISAMTIINGRQQHTEFSSAVQDFQSSLNDIANDVSNGYYANSTNSGKMITCNPTTASIGASAGPVSFPAPGTTDNQGGNTGCIFIGKSIVFSPQNTSNEQFATISLVGRQYINGDPAFGDVQSYDSSGSGVQALVRTAVFPNVPDAYTLTRIGGGVTAECVLYANGTGASDVPNTAAGQRPCTASSTLTPIDTITFMNTFHGVNVSTGEVDRGAKQVDLVVPTSGLVGPLTGRSIIQAATDLNGYYDSSKSKANPVGGIYVCLQSNGTQQYAIVTIGGKGSRFSASAQVYDGRCV